MNPPLYHVGETVRMQVDHVTTKDNKLVECRVEFIDDCLIVNARICWDGTPRYCVLPPQAEMVHDVPQFALIEMGAGA